MFIVENSIFSENVSNKKEGYLSLLKEPFPPFFEIKSTAELAAVSKTLSALL